MTTIGNDTLDFIIEQIFDGLLPVAEQRGWPCSLEPGPYEDATTRVIVMEVAGKEHFFYPSIDGDEVVLKMDDYRDPPRFLQQRMHMDDPAWSPDSHVSTVVEFAERK